MKHASTVLLAVAVAVLAAACAQESPPYSHKQQAAEIDPDMSTHQPPDDGSDDEQPTVPGVSDAGLGGGKTVSLTDEQWRAVLSEQEYHVLRRSGTERAGTGRYLDHDATLAGAFHCVGCGNRLYDAAHKFHSGCGWPSFNQQIEPGAITEHRDTSHGMIRTEMRCARCGGHLGHIFADAPDQPTGLRHCVNGTALIFVPYGLEPADVILAHRREQAGK